MVLSKSSGRTDERTDGSEFVGPFPSYVGGPISVARINVALINAFRVYALIFRAVNGFSWQYELER